MQQVRNPFFPILFSPLQLRGVTLPNRIVMSAMSSKLGTENGELTDDHFAYYAERAHGGVGMIIVEYTCVESRLGRAYAKQLRLDRAEHVGAHRRLAAMIAAAGAVPAVQLHHAGRQTTPDNLGGLQPVAPSVVTSSADERLMCRALEPTEIQDLIGRFEQSAAWAVDAGYRLVELHAAHGYLFHQFLSPRTNFRDDAWGGDFERRLRFPVEVIKAIRRAIGPDIPLSYRLSAAELTEGGLTVEDMAEIVPHLVAAGVDVLSVSSGIRKSNQYTIDPMAMDEGWRVPYASRLRAAGGVPVMAVGPFRHPEYAESALADRHVDMIALGRPLLADPDWARKAEEGQSDRIRQCTSCNYCAGAPRIRCAENPRVGRELDAPLSRPVDGQKAIVIGGGPGGMAAALFLEDAGYQVNLWEARGHLGGGLIASAVPPKKDKLFWYLDHLKAELARTKIQVRLGIPASEHDVLLHNPDLVVIATGALLKQIPFPISPGTEVVQAYDLLMEPVADAQSWSGRPVVVYGGGETGCETAEYLAEREADVTIVTRSTIEELARDAERLYRRFLIPRLLENPRIRVTEKTHILSVEGRKVHLRGPSTEYWLSADCVVVAQGRETGSDLASSLRAHGVQCREIGDVREVGRIGDAVTDAYLLVKEARKTSKPGRPTSLVNVA